MTRPAKSVRAAAGQKAKLTKAGRPGRDDTVIFNGDTSDRSVGKVLEWLGGIPASVGPSVNFRPQPELEFDLEKDTSRAPVFMTVDHVERVHEPKRVDSRVPIECDMSEILKPESERGESEARWAGFWKC